MTAQKVAQSKASDVRFPKKIHLQHFNIVGTPNFHTSLINFPYNLCFFRVPSLQLVKDALKSIFKIKLVGLHQIDANHEILIVQQKPHHVLHVPDCLKSIYKSVFCVKNDINFGVE